MMTKFDGYIVFKHPNLVNCHLAAFKELHKTVQLSISP